MFRYQSQLPLRHNGGIVLPIISFELADKMPLRKLVAKVQLPSLDDQDIVRLIIGSGDKVYTDKVIKQSPPLWWYDAVLKMREAQLDSVRRTSQAATASEIDAMFEQQMAWHAEGLLTKTPCRSWAETVVRGAASFEVAAPVLEEHFSSLWRAANRKKWR